MPGRNRRLLADTAVAQPALCALSVAQARALVKRGVKPDYVAGFSSADGALAVSGMLDAKTVFSWCEIARASWPKRAGCDWALCAL
ncbi:MAG: hypothetical protein ACLT98_02660 [Eggerthellaceae bacterium]